MKPTQESVSAGDRTKQHHGGESGENRKPDASRTLLADAADCGTENDRDSDENGPIYHELDPVVVAGEPPLPSFHAYQSIVDVRRELVQLRSSGSANSFDASTTACSAVTPSSSCGDVSGHATNASGSKWTLFSRLRLPRRTSATARQRQISDSVSDRTVTSPSHSSTAATSGSGCTPLSCHPTSWRGENIAGIARADYFYLSNADVRRHLAPVPAGTSPRDVARCGSAVQTDSEVRRRGRCRLVNSSPFSSPCCGVRMAEIRAACRIQSCGPRIISDVDPT